MTDNLSTGARRERALADIAALHAEALAGVDEARVALTELDEALCDAMEAIEDI